MLRIRIRMILQYTALNSQAVLLWYLSWEPDVRHLQPTGLSGTHSWEMSLAATNGDAHSVFCRQPTEDYSPPCSSVNHLVFPMNPLTSSTLDLMSITPSLSTTSDSALICSIKRLFFVAPRNSSALHTSKYWYSEFAYASCLNLQMQLDQ